MDYQQNKQQNRLIYIYNLNRIMETRNFTPKKENKSKNEESKIRDINLYIQNRVMPILAPLQIELLTRQPTNIKEYCVTWLKNYSFNKREEIKEFISDDESQEVFKQKRRKKLKNKKGFRKGISGDSTKEWLKLMHKPRQISLTEWPEQTKINLILNMKKCVFFEHLTSQNLMKVISHMRKLQFREGDVVISEGEDGNQLYIVEQGKFQCEKKGCSQVLKVYKVGQMFGELALLYNHPRASTVIALTQGKLYGLGRHEFSMILRSKMVEKLHQCQTLVNNIEFFKDLDIYERSKLFQNLEQIKVGPNKFIIQEGEVGNSFYLVAQGQLVAYKQKNNENKLVYAYKKGDYFGEIALLKNIPRQASIKTLTEARLFYINRDSFVRIIGPLQGILNRSCERYNFGSEQLNGHTSL